MAVNGTLRSEHVNANMRLYATDGKLLDEKDTTFIVGSQSHGRVFSVPEVKGNAFLFLTLTNEKGDTIANNDYMLAERMDEYDWEASDWITTPIKRYADYTSLASLEKQSCRQRPSQATTVTACAFASTLTTPARRWPCSCGSR